MNTDIVAHMSRTAARVAMLIPPLIPLLIYANWVVACVELGRLPVPMRDHPKHVGQLTPVLHWFMAWGLVADAAVHPNAQPSRARAHTRSGYGAMMVGPAARGPIAGATRHPSQV